jgi:hypothetical protein
MNDDEVLARPVGWWLKEADARIDAAFDRALEGSPVNRRGWQVLGVLAGQPTSRADLAASLASFDAPQVVGRVVGELQELRWVEEESGLLRLTPGGSQAQSDLASLVDRVRQQASSALPPEDYVTLVRLLARLTEAL